MRFSRYAVHLSITAQLPGHTMADVHRLYNLPPLLRLPPHFRQHVYTTAGILGCNSFARFTNLNSHGLLDRNHGRPPFIITYSLLLTCQTVYEEISARGCAYHHFVIRFSDHGSLGSFPRLSTKSLRALRRLTIDLNVASCAFGMLCDHWLRPWESLSTTQPTSHLASLIALLM